MFHTETSRTNCIFGFCKSISKTLKTKRAFFCITFPIQTSLASNAPEDLIAGMGKNGQYFDVIPSQNLVIIRMGEAPDSDDLVPINFHNEMWSYLNDILF